MKSGRTIAGKREKTEIESERTRVRKHLKRTKTNTLVLVILLAAILLVLSVIGVKNLIEALTRNDVAEEVVYTVKAEIIDENGLGQIGNGTKKYISQLENDLYDLGYAVKRVILPYGMMREIDVYLDGYDGYFKVSMDRDAAVSAEDIDRMVKYMGEHLFEYIDVRLKGKAYWK